MNNFYSNIGLIGCGAMGSALAKGMIKKGGVNPSTVYLYDINPDRQNKLASELKAKATKDYRELVSSCRIIFIAVKPQDTTSLLGIISPNINNEHIIISIAAGITINFMKNCLPADTKIIRLMPNTPCLIGEGTIIISLGEMVSKKEFFEVENLLKPLGITLRLPEKLMDAATGLSGTGPAYVFLFIETMIDAGVSVGIRRDVASKIVIQNVVGSARMLQANSKHPAELRNTVTSPAGTTAAALHIMEDSGFRSCLLKAIIGATKRSEELSRG